MALINKRQKKQQTNKKTTNKQKNKQTKKQQTNKNFVLIPSSQKKKCLEYNLKPV